MQDLLGLDNLELEEKAIKIGTFKKKLSIELGRVFKETKVELNKGYRQHFGNFVR